MTRTRLLIGGGALAAAALVVALIVFQPWLLFVNVTVNETLPTATVTPGATETPGATATPVAQPILLLSGTFVSNEHETTGTASVIGNPDGSRVLALENLATSNGPDVHVWL